MSLLRFHLLIETDYKMHATYKYKYKTQHIHKTLYYFVIKDFTQYFSWIISAFNSINLPLPLPFFAPLFSVSFLILSSIYFFFLIEKKEEEIESEEMRMNMS